MITIMVNDRPVELAHQVTLQEMLAQLDLADDGTALAVNQIIISRSEWPRHRLTDGDDILLFQAIAGG